MSLHVVATAGHVDHGKSSLVLRLTGTDPDRFEEEKRRGLTIDLGYAWLTLPSGAEVGFVDVPGHERFVRNMLAGVGPVRMVLFVVAADEGWKPQSEEHLAIIDILGVHGAIIALTKCDLVDSEGLQAARTEIAEKTAGTALEGAPVVVCSSVTGDGIDDLIAQLDRMVASAPAGVSEVQRPRQFIDRVFTIKGAGTVVTGTLTGGSLRVGHDVEVLPEGVRARIRGLQSHKRTLEEAEPTSRVAVNLSGVERDDLGRGDALVLPGQWRPTSVFEASIRPVRGLDKPLSPRGAYKIFAGSAERDARLRFYGDSGFVRVTLAHPLVLDVLDRFVLREAGRGQTVGGGVVLDIAPPSRPGADAPARLAARASESRDGIASLLVSERGAVPDSDLPALTGTHPGEVGGATRVGDWWVSDRMLSAVSEAVASALAEFHTANPMREGTDLGHVRTLTSDQLTRSRIGADPALVEALLGRLETQGVLVRSGSAIRLASHEPETGNEDVARLLAAAAGPTPPSIPELRGAGFDDSLIRAAMDSGALVRIGPDMIVTAELAADAESTLRELAAQGTPITVSMFRERLGTSRKYAVPLLEHFDRRGITRRDGDRRILRAT